MTTRRAGSVKRSNTAIWLPRRTPRTSGRLCYLAGSRAMRAPARTRPLFHRFPAERFHEGTTVGQADVRKVQDHSPPRGGAGHLLEPAAQAAAGLGMARISGINIPLNKRVEI